MRAGWFVFCSLGAWLVAAAALARVERFAVVVGNNRGFASDVALRYAEADARKVAEVLRELGAVEPANLVVLAGSDADTARRTLITVNDRTRAAVSKPDTSVVLFVYYSAMRTRRRCTSGRVGSSSGAAVLFVQTFRAEGTAPARTSIAGNASAYLALFYELPAGLYLALDGEAQLYVLRLQEKRHESLRAAFAPRGTLALGKHF